MSSSFSNPLRASFNRRCLLTYCNGVGGEGAVRNRSLDFQKNLVWASYSIFEILGWSTKCREITRAYTQILQLKLWYELCYRCVCQQRRKINLRANILPTHSSLMSLIIVHTFRVPNRVSGLSFFFLRAWFSCNLEKRKRISM